jgi:hypothetical protein
MAKYPRTLCCLLLISQSEEPQLLSRSSRPVSKRAPCPSISPPVEELTLSQRTHWPRSVLAITKITPSTHPTFPLQLCCHSLYWYAPPGHLACLVTCLSVGEDTGRASKRYESCAERMLAVQNKYAICKRWRQHSTHDATCSAAWNHISSSTTAAVEVVKTSIALVGLELIVGLTQSVD